jgi:hypothetical protein
MEPASEQTTAVERPAHVSWAVMALTSSIVLGFLASVLRLAGRVSGTTMMLALLIVVAFFMIYGYLILKISVGRNWARIILLVLVLFGIPFAVPAYIVEVKKNFFSGALSILVAFLQLLGTGLLFTRSSNPWFRKRR